MLTWVALSKAAVRNNMTVLRSRLASHVLLCPSVKANAYGHGLVPMAKLFARFGADWLSVNSLEEALTLRQRGVRLPLYIMGYIEKRALAEVVRHGFRMVAYNRESILRLSRIATRMRKKALVHIKIETGTHRQGVLTHEAVPFLLWAAQQPGIVIDGIATHFANIEQMRPTPTLNPYAAAQLKIFLQVIRSARERGLSIPIRHCANTAATLLFPETHETMVRPGIGSFGMYPSASVEAVCRAKKQPRLQPVLTWKTRVAQVKSLRKGISIGYGCTYKAKRSMTMAVVPAGYYDGIDRKLGNRGAVLIHGKRAPIVGWVCMNMMMVDVTRIRGVRPEAEVVLLGAQGKDCITAEEFASWCHTINYEIPTRINEGIPRIVV